MLGLSRTYSKLGLKGALMLGTGLVAVPAYAQDQDQDFGGIDEIIVTASKRSESLQDAAIAITAFSGEDLERSGATEFFDYASKVPNLGFAAEADGRFDSRKTGLRGVFGAGQSSTGGTTGFYIDDLPVPETMNPRVMDVERVEVLRGPSGTLYGARSMGGTIRMISKQPDLNENSSRAHAMISDVSEGGANYQIDGATNLVIQDGKAAVRIMGYFGENSGVFDRVRNPNSPGPDFADQKNVDDETFYGGQISGLLQVSESISFTPRFIYQRIEADGLPFADNETDNFVQERSFNIEEPGRDEFYIASGTFNVELDIGNIVSATSYFDRSIVEDEDETFVLQFFFGTPPVASPITETVDFEAFVHETRFTSAFEGPFQITAGFFYQETEQFLEYPPALAPGLSAAFTQIINDACAADPACTDEPIPLSPGALGTDLIFETQSSFDTDEIAFFGEASFDVNDWITATVGGRWSDSKAIFEVASDGLANGGPTSLPRNSQSESSFNPKFLLEAQVDEDVNIYATASKGFRIGGVNGNVPVDFCADDLAALGNPDPESLRTFDSDSLWNYEVGVKTSLADNRATLNVAAFQIDWSDVIQFVRLSCGFQFIANAGNARNRGLEVELNVAPAPGWEFNLGMGYTDAKFTKITNPFAAINVGDRVQQVPEWTFTGGGQYMFGISDNMDGFVRGDFSYYGDSLSANNEATIPRKRPSWTLVNMRAGIIKEGWELTAFVNNLTNEHANLADNRSIAAEHPDRQRIVINRPRTVGVEVRTNF